jgi:nitrite reductase (NADH) small subunit
MTLLDDIRGDVLVWTTACPFDRLIPGRGVGVLLDDGSQAALFRLDDDSLHAVGNIDPFSGAAVLSRGIVGDRAGRAVVQSPIKKQAFAFDDGGCLDDPMVSVPVYRARRTDDGQVQIGRPD